MSVPALKNYTIHKWTIKGLASAEEDLVAIEEPLEIVLIHYVKDTLEETQLTLTMRSPGSDEELAVGFLFNEGIIASFKDIEKIKYCIKSEEGKRNKLRVTLKENVVVDSISLKRNFASTSSCGVCGKQLLEQVCTVFNKIEFQEKVKLSTLLGFPEQLNSEQLVFKHTGGIHACGLFTSGGSLISLKEDIGRHNALDKVIGNQLLQEHSFKQTIIVLSGRVGYEMAQKTAKAGIPILVAIGAPTSLAIDIAQEAGICLVGFVKNNSLNCYTHAEYIDFEK